MTLIFCDNKVYLKDMLCIAAKEIGGFFTKEILDNGAGIKEQIEEYKGPLITVPYRPVSSKHTFQKEEVRQFLKGHPDLCFGRPCVNSTSIYQVREEFYLLDRIVEIESTGGMYGLGYIIGEKEIDEKYWAYQCHFKNDPILPATIMMEGVIQISMFFQIYQGLLNGEKKVFSRFEPGNVIKSSFRGQVHKGNHLLRFRIDVKELTREDYGYRFAHNSSVFCDGVYIISQKNAVVQIMDQYEGK
jgi:3-hydroxymyristoyl/3-hydroxydecanoyl-(acyl carrier protein) dehydratase